MHHIAVYVWCAITALFVGRIGVELFIAWYSVTQPELTPLQVTRHCCEMLLATAAAVVAVLTL